MSHINKELSWKQKRFCQIYLELNGNATQAALEAYNSTYKTSKVIGYQNLQKPHIQSYLRLLMDGIGLSDKEIVVNLKTIIQDGIKSGTTQAKDAVKAIELVTKLKDMAPSKKVETLSTNLSTNLQELPTKELIEQLREVIAENERLLRGMDTGSYTNSTG